MRRAVGRAAVVLRDEGVRALWFKVLGETVYRRLRLVELRPEHAVETNSELPLSFRFLTLGDAESYARLRPGVPPPAVRERLARERCFGAWLDGRLISTRWVARGSAEIEYLGRTLELDAGDVWIADTFTDPDHRGHDVSPAAGAALARALRSEGIERQLGGVLPENALGVRAYEQAGYRRAGAVGYVRFGRFRRDFLRRG